MVEEMIGTAVASAIAVVGLMKTLTFISDRKNGGASQYVTEANCKERHEALAVGRAEVKQDLLLHRADQKMENQEYRSGIHEEIKALRLEILEVGKKIDKLPTVIRRVK